MSRLIINGGYIKQLCNVSIMEKYKKITNIYIKKQEKPKWNNGIVMIGSKFIANITSDIDYSIKIVLYQNSHCYYGIPTLLINDMIYFESPKIFDFTVILYSDINDLSHIINSDIYRKETIPL